MVCVSDKMIRIAQIGTKHAHARGKYHTLLKFPDLFEVVGVVESDEKQRTEMESNGYEGATWLTETQLFSTEGLKAVVVETEVSELVPTAQRCIESGFHVHLDKPAGASMSAFQQLHETADQAGLTIQMGYMFRYNPGFEFLFDAITNGWLGAITEVNGMIGKSAEDLLRLTIARFSGGGMFELGCHIIDPLVTILGPPEGVETFTFRSHPEKDNLADNQLAVFRYPTAVATIRSNHIDPHKRRKFEVIGEKGAVIIDPLEPPIMKLSLNEKFGRFSEGYQRVDLTFQDGRFDGEFIDFAKVIRNEKKLRWDSSHDLAVHKAILQASEMEVD